MPNQGAEVVARWVHRQKIHCYEVLFEYGGGHKVYKTTELFISNVEHLNEIPGYSWFWITYEFIMYYKHEKHYSYIMLKSGFYRMCQLCLSLF